MNEMTQALNIVQQFYAAIGDGNMDAAAALMANDVNWMEAENFPLADRNPYVGPQAVIEGDFTVTNRLFIDEPASCFSARLSRART